MADMIARLKVDSSEYDSKIRRAAEGIKRYADECKQVGGTLEHLDEGVLEFVQALGKMDTVGQTTKQQLREMTNALTDLTATYRGLTDKEKNSPFGQALAQSIDQLTERAGNAKDAMADVAASITNAASDTRLFDQMAQGMSVATAGFQGLTGAGKLLGIEMGNDVEVIAKLQAAMAVTNSLTTIQTALQKQSALMQGVQAVQATAAATAQALYARNTALATAAGAAFNAVAKANPYVLLASAVAAVGVALVGFSKNAKKATEATETQTDAMKQAQRMADIWKNTMGSTYSSLMTKYDELKRQWQSLASEHSKTEWIKKNQTALQNLGGAVTDVKSAEEFFNNNTDAVVQSFVRRAQAAARVAQLTELYRKQIELLDKKSQASADIAADAQRSGRSAKAGDEITDKSFRSSRYGSVNAQGKWVFSDAGAKLYSGMDTSNSSAVMKIDLELQANQAEIDKVKDSITNEFKDVIIGVGGSGGSTKTEIVAITGSIDAQTKKVQDLQKAWRAAADDNSRQKIKAELDEQQYVLDRLTGKEKFDPSKLQQMQGLSVLTQGAELTLPVKLEIESPAQKLTAEIQRLKEAMAGVWNPDEVVVYKERIAELENQLAAYQGNIVSGGKSANEAWKNTASVVNAVGSALNNIQDPSAKIAAIVAQGIASLVAAYGDALAKDNSSKFNIYQFLGTSLAATAQMIAQISQIHSATGYAGGGIVRGNTYSCDQIPAMLNAGEVVLNRSQTANLANELQGAGRSLHVTGYLRGEDIALVADRWGRRTGKGELAFWK